jgi:hypothetical protein
MIRTLVAEFAALFAPAPPEMRSSRRVWLLLLVIVTVGAVVRFWGLGAVGLHGDEKTMALPMQHLVEHGTPLMPSGMFYPRALGQLYLMAASVEAFGETEWAMRLPSALCGVLLIVLAWFVGRRFLALPWNLAFVAAVALLPQFIVDAQTARMYVFLLTSIAGFLLLLFEWERTGRLAFLAGAVLMLLIGLQFHTLAVFSAPLLLFPGLVRGDLRKVMAGALAFAFIVAAFFAIDVWTQSHYPPPEKVEGFEAPPQGPKARWAVPDLPPWLAVLALTAAAGLAAFVVRPLPRRAALVAGALLALGLSAQALFAWHAAALLLIAGLVVAQRAGQLPPRRVAVLAGVCAVLALAQIVLIHSQGTGSWRQTLGALTGWPSIWPYLVMSGYSIAASLLIAIALLRALWRVAHRQPVPDHVLFVLIGVWLPLFLIGFFSWYVPPRYVEGQSLPLFLGAFAAAQWLFGVRLQALEPRSALRAAAVGSAAVCLLIVNPILVARTVNAGYAIHPDHKGAAEFMRSLDLGPHDVIVAEDVLHQTYYLGHVDYLLVAKYAAAQFVRNVDGEVREIYVHAPVIGSGAELAALLDDPSRGTVYVIGSGELHEDGRRHARGLGIQEVLDSPRFETIYHGRDGLTQIWKAPPPSLAARK